MLDRIRGERLSSGTQEHYFMKIISGRNLVNTSLNNEKPNWNGENHRVTV